ncbi:hypothetical protein VE03_10530, partial [Pseudogymnoascus sp. 23342-1-I1]
MEDIGRIGTNPLSIASQYGYEAIVKILLEHGANVDDVDRTSATPIVWILLGHGVNVEDADQTGSIALLRANQNGYGAILTTLLKRYNFFDSKEDTSNSDCDSDSDFMKHESDSESDEVNSFKDDESLTKEDDLDDEVNGLEGDESAYK